VTSTELLLYFRSMVARVEYAKALFPISYQKEEKQMLVNN